MEIKMRFFCKCMMKGCSVLEMLLFDRCTGTCAHTCTWTIPTANTSIPFNICNYLQCCIEFSRRIVCMFMSVWVLSNISSPGRFYLSFFIIVMDNLGMCKHILVYVQIGLHCKGQHSRSCFQYILYLGWPYVPLKDRLLFSDGQNRCVLLECLHVQQCIVKLFKQTVGYTKSLEYAANPVSDSTQYTSYYTARHISAAQDHLQ